MTQTHSHLKEAARKATSRLALSLGLTLGFVAIELAAGLFANSLALLTDAAHNATDVIALGISWYAIRLTSQPANSRQTYGYHRAGILAALVNSTTLVLIALGIFYEAYRRLMAPPEVRADILVGVGILAFLVNLATALLVHKGSQQDLNLRAAFVHLMGDVLSTLGAVAAGIGIYFTGWNWLDPLASILIGAMILWSAWGILRETVDILLEATPRDVNIDRMVRDMVQIPGVLGVHDLHVWSITRGLRTMSAHILIDDMPVSTGAGIQAQVNDLLRRHYRIAHATLQLESVGCDLASLYCDIDAVHMHKLLK
ncbi:MAG: cation diffusion facilitator family transporter [Bacteroidota bacterium]